MDDKVRASEGNSRTVARIGGVYTMQVVVSIRSARNLRRVRRAGTVRIEAPETRRVCALARDERRAKAREYKSLTCEVPKRRHVSENRQAMAA